MSLKKCAGVAAWFVLASLGVLMLAACNGQVGGSCHYGPPFEAEVIVTGVEDGEVRARLLPGPLPAPLVAGGELILRAPTESVSVGERRPVSVRVIESGTCTPVSAAWR
ncbi:hypothetical protein HUS23_07965 [Ectothiorhodospiraceae bacterium 2226]|nr:hypothetical protein HUS23_07965 [Ectothiorhodospiraceae bacterium 2226]